MSRITKWKLENTKIKVVFRLQFHATHIPQLGWDKLFISLIPADSGKPSAKTSKANVRNGTCKWADPIYETTRLLQDIKTKHYDEKLYKLVVAMGSSRSSVLGEATINLADYADASKPCSVTLPLLGSDSGTILHVTVQLLTSKTGFREFEQQRELRDRGLPADQNSPEEHSSRKISYSADICNDQINKVITRVRFKEKSKELALVEGEVRSNEEYADSALGFDGSSNTSESLYAEKHDTSSTHEIDSLKSTVSGDLAGISLGQSPNLEKVDPSDQQFLAPGTNDWVQAWSSDYSVENDLTALYEENNKLRGFLEVAESSIQDLRLEVSSLRGHADEIGNEAQIFSKQLAAEIVSGEELAKEVSGLKSECSMLKGDLEKLEISKSPPPFSVTGAIVTENTHLFQDSHLTWLKGLLAMEDGIKNLQSKACFGFHERDFRFLHADLDALLGTLLNLKQGVGLTVSGIDSIPSEEASLREIQEINLNKNGNYETGTGFDVDAHQPELGMLPCLSIPGLVSYEPDSIDATNAMKGKLFELLRELDESKVEREGLTQKMNQMECYYEALVLELEENQRQMLAELQNLRNDHSASLYTISSTKAEMETMHHDLNDQLLRVSEDKSYLDTLNKELERRAITAESALKRARLNYSIAVNKLQNDLEHLSLQVLSLFETNENLIRQAFIDPSHPGSPGDPEVADSQKFDTRVAHVEKLVQFQNQSVGLKKQQMGGDILLDDLKRSLHSQEELYRKVEEEACEMHFVNIYLDVLSKALQESLLQAGADVKYMNVKINELMQQLQLSTESKELLMQKLQTAIDDALTLDEDRSTCIAKCNDMARQIETLEVNFQNVTCENHLLVQKITEWESLAMHYKSYESIYENCAEEKTQLACLLENKTVENVDLQHGISSLQEELKALRTEFDELAYEKENLQTFVSSLQNKLQSLLDSYDKSIGGLHSLHESGHLNLETEDLTGVLFRLEEVQHKACEKILLLAEEKKGLVQERDIAQVSVATTKSDIALMKQKYEFDIKNMVDKLDASNRAVQKLQLDVDTVAGRLKASSEVEEKNTQQHNELLADLNRLEYELQELTSKNGDLGQEMLSLETVTDELERCKLTAAKLQMENNALMASLQNKNDESMTLSLELKALKESLQSLRDENQALVVSSHDKTEETTQLASELSSLKDSWRSMHDQTQAFIASSQDKSEEATKLAIELDALKENLQFLHDENQALLASLRNKTEETSKLEAKIKYFNESLQAVHDAKEALMVSSRDKVDETAELASEMIRLKERLQSLQDEKETLMKVAKDKSDESAKLSVELNSSRECLQSLRNENQALMASLQSKTEESALDLSELHTSRQSLLSLQDKLHDKSSLQCGLQSTITELTSQLNGKQSQLLQLEAELVHLKQLLSDSELEKSRSCNLLMHYEECAKNAREESSSVSALEAQLSDMHELLIAADVGLVFTKSQYDARVEEIIQQLYSLHGNFSELQRKHDDVETALNQCETSNVQYIEENISLLKRFDVVNSDYEASISENGLLIERNRILRAELEECMNKIQHLGVCHCEGNCERSQEVGRLKHMLVSSEEEIDSILLSNEELEVIVLVLREKWNEQKDQIIALEGYHDQLMILQVKLSEQISKTEEFRNLSVHLKELKDKADAECTKAREKREPEGPPVAVQESLRIAFIKEQYETKLQELKQQLSISKKHSEEMLWKLQDAIDDIENRKKAEASHLRKNEELGMKILDLESELQSLLSEKREKTNTYDVMKAEMECSLISLECCKEEKQKLEASLKECNEEKSKIAVELTLTKELLENSKLAMEMQKESNDGSCFACGLHFNKVHPKDSTTILGCGRESLPNDLEQESSRNCKEVSHAQPDPAEEVDDSRSLLNAQRQQDGFGLIGGNGLDSPVLIDQEKLLHSDTRHLSVINGHFRAETLRSSMDHLSNELERMKNENSLFQDDNDFCQKFPDLQRELMKLQKTNEELRSMFPLFSDFSRSGNALERVLALEIELAESLQAKKSSPVLFQSSFLKTHSDEEAVFKSFRDINELIKDMLDIKGRYTTVETELKEMHDRYSQLSLQFAEVEGERQKLMMTLKNVRASKKAQYLNRSSSAALGDYSS